jgi:hypothetical protein
VVDDGALLWAVSCSCDCGVVGTHAGSRTRPP